MKAFEDRKRNIVEYRRFLESCNFIKVIIPLHFLSPTLSCANSFRRSFFFQPNSQWRKVQDRLEVDERCSRLEKIDQLEIFQVSSFLIDQELSVKSTLS